MIIFFEVFLQLASSIFRFKSLLFLLCHYFESLVFMTSSDDINDLKNHNKRVTSQENHLKFLNMYDNPWHIGIVHVFCLAVVISCIHYDSCYIFHIQCFLLNLKNIPHDFHFFLSCHHWIWEKNLKIKISCQKNNAFNSKFISYNFIPLEYINFEGYVTLGTSPEKILLMKDPF